MCSGEAPAEEPALDLGVSLARRLEAEVLVLGIAESPKVRQDFLNSLVREWLERTGVDAAVLTRRGPAHEAIARTAREHDFGLVILSGGYWRTHHGAMYALINRSRASVLVPRRVRPGSPLQRLLVCTGGEAVSRPAVELAGRLARAMGGRVTLFHVMAEPPGLFAGMKTEEDPAQVMATGTRLGSCLRELDELLSDLEVDHSVKLRYGRVVPAIVGELEQGGYDLLVTGSHSEVHGYFMGDMARALLRESPCSVLVARTAPSESRGLLERLKSLLPLPKGRQPLPVPTLGQLRDGGEATEE